MQKLKSLLVYLTFLFPTTCLADNWTISDPNHISETYAYTYGGVLSSANSSNGTFLAAWVDVDNENAPTYSFYTQGSGWSPISTFPDNTSTFLQANVVNSSDPSTGQFLASWTSTSIIEEETFVQYPTVSLYTPGSGWSSPDSLLTSQATYNTSNVFDSVNNRYLVTWADVNNNNYPTYAFYHTNTGWGTPSPITTISVTRNIYSCFNSAENQILSVWSNNNTGFVNYSFYAENSGWSTVENIPGSSVNADVFCAYNPVTDQYMITWNDINQSLHPYYSIYTPGTGWSSMSPITTNSSVNGNVGISCDTTSGLFLATWSSANSNGNLVYSFYTPGNGWSQPQFISEIANSSGDILTSFNSSTNQFLATWPDTSNPDLMFDPSFAFFTADEPSVLFPSITSINPSSSTHNHHNKTVVTIIGIHFTGTTSVLFGSHKALDFTVVSDTEIRATVPHGHGTVDVRVITCPGESVITSVDQFTYIPSPPRHLQGRQYKIVQHQHIVFENVIVWEAPAHGHPAAYRIYRDALLTDLVREVKVKHPLEFCEVVGSPDKSSRTYYIVSVDAFGAQSLSAKIVIKDCHH